MALPPLETTSLVAWVFKLIIGTLVGLLVWDKKENKKTLQRHTEEIATLKSESVSEDKVRYIIKDELHPIRDDLKEVKELVATNTKVVTDLAVKLAEQEGYKKAMETIKTATG